MGITFMMCEDMDLGQLYDLSVGRADRKAQLDLISKTSDSGIKRFPLQSKPILSVFMEVVEQFGNSIVEQGTLSFPTQPISGGDKTCVAF